MGPSKITQLWAIKGTMRNCRFSQSKQDRLIWHFIAGTMVRTAARLVGVRSNWAAFYSHRLRHVIAYELEAESEAMFGGKIEIDDGYFGGRHIGKGGCGAAGKNQYLLKRGWKVYTPVIPNATGKTSVPTIERKVTPDSIVYSVSWRGCNALDVSSFKHCRINHSELLQRVEITSMALRIFGNKASSHVQIQRCPERAFCAIFESMRVAFQYTWPKAPVSDPKTMG